MQKSISLLTISIITLLSNNCIAQQEAPTLSLPTSSDVSSLPPSINCKDLYNHHLQGVCRSGESVYWSFTTKIVKTDLQGNVLKAVEADNHQGDLCFHNGELLVAVNLGKFNSPAGDANSWVYVFSPDDLSITARHKLPEVIYGAGGITTADEHLFVVGGLPDGIQENYIYEYDEEYNFVKKHTLPSGHTHLGIQTVEFADGQWWFGCYGSPSVLLTATRDFKQVKRHNFDASLGIISVADKLFYVAKGLREKSLHGGELKLAIPDRETGLKFIPTVN